MIHSALMSEMTCRRQSPIDIVKHHLVVLSGKKKSNNDEDLMENPRGFDLFLLFMTPEEAQQHLCLLMRLASFGSLALLPGVLV